MPASTPWARRRTAPASTRSTIGRNRRCTSARTGSAACAKGLTLRMGQTHVHRYLHPLLAHIESGRLDPTFLVSHRWPLSRAPEAYRIWNDKSDDCTKFVLDPTR